MLDIFDVIADPTRREILALLRDRQKKSAQHKSSDMAVSEIVAHLELTQPSVSKHLKVLREAKLVSVREEGHHRYYAFSPEPLVEVEDWVISFTYADLPQASLGEYLNQETREFAATVGKVLADTGYRVTTAAARVRPKKWRKD